MQHRTSLRVEWYVVILIVVEILLSLYDIVLESKKALLLGRFLLDIL